MTARPIVGIAGVGLIGASIGLRARRCGWATIGWDPDLSHAEAGHANGALSELVPSFEELAQCATILVIAAPLDGTLLLLDALAAGAPPRAELIVDVASVKAPVARAGATLGAFVATHPIAGSERSGPLAARADLFLGRTWTYDPAAGGEAVARARSFISAMGATPHPLASDEHDRIIALTSHLPQLLSVALGARLGPELERADVVALCGTGVRSMLRLGASSWPIWRAIVAANGLPIAQELRRFAGVLSRVADALDAGTPGALADDFTISSDAVARLGTNPSVPQTGEVATTSPQER